MHFENMLSYISLLKLDTNFNLTISLSLKSIHMASSTKIIKNVILSYFMSRLLSLNLNFFYFRDRRRRHNSLQL